MGYTVTPFDPEILTEERKYLGKKPGAVLPRAVVIAPGAFANIKGYLFLLRAYVEEGGRVLVLTHGPSAIATMRTAERAAQPASDEAQPGTAGGTIAYSVESVSRGNTTSSRWSQ